jgi:hypothetical protein
LVSPIIIVHIIMLLKIVLNTKSLLFFLFSKINYLSLSINGYIDKNVSTLFSHYTMACVTQATTYGWRKIPSSTKNNRKIRHQHRFGRWVCMWMTEFSGTLMFRACVTRGFLTVYNCPKWKASLLKASMKCNVDSESCFPCIWRRKF